jgi:hypothetical protein
MQTANGSLEAVTGRKLIKKFLKRTSIWNLQLEHTEETKMI